MKKSINYLMESIYDAILRGEYEFGKIDLYTIEIIVGTNDSDRVTVCFWIGNGKDFCYLREFIYSSVEMRAIHYTDPELEKKRIRVWDIIENRILLLDVENREKEIKELENRLQRLKNGN